jgi:hypothetical protein
VIFQSAKGTSISNLLIFENSKAMFSILSMW